MTVLENKTAARARTTGTIDLRGEGAPAPAAVLADPTGRRAALLRAIGRVVGALFVLWFCGLVLAGLGLLPVSDLPLGRSLGPVGQPKKLTALPRPRQPSRRDLRPARPLPAASAPVSETTRPNSNTPVTPRHSSTPATTTRPGRRLGNSRTPGTAPTATTPATTQTTTHGKSGSAPAYGRQPTTTTTTTSTTPTTAPGKSGSAPGHDPTATRGNGAALH